MAHLYGKYLCLKQNITGGLYSANHWTQASELKR